MQATRSDIKNWIEYLISRTSEEYSWIFIKEPWQGKSHGKKLKNGSSTWPAILLPQHGDKKKGTGAI